jgi:hypothetical protein
VEWLKQQSACLANVRLDSNFRTARKKKVYILLEIPRKCDLSLTHLKFAFMIMKSEDDPIFYST